MSSLPIIRSATITRQTRRHAGGHGIRDLDLPQPRRAIPLNQLADELANWNEQQDRAKDAYYRKPLERR